MQLPALVARAGERLAEGRAPHDLLYQIAVLVYVYVRLVGCAKEVMVVTHHLLIRADEHEGDVVRLALDKRVKLKHLLYVVQVDELIDDTVRVARYVAKRRILGRLLV